MFKKFSLESRLSNGFAMITKNGLKVLAIEQFDIHTRLEVKKMLNTVKIDINEFDTKFSECRNKL